MSRARISIEHWDAVPAWKKEGTEGMFNVIIETPMFNGEVRKETRSFSYGAFASHETASEAADRACVYSEGATQLYYALGLGFLEWGVGGRLQAQLLAKRIDAEMEVSK